MSLTLRQLVDRVLDSISLNRPVKIVDSNDTTARQVLSSAQDILLEILDHQHAWVLATRLHSFTTTDGQEGYPLPDGFDSFVDRSAWDNTNFREMANVTYQEWQMIKSSVVSARAGFRLFRLLDDSGVKKFSIDPTPSADGENLSYWYKSVNVVVGAGGVQGNQSEFKADNDTTIFPDRVMISGTKYRMLNRLGLSFLEELSEFEAALTAATAKDDGSPDIFIGETINDPLIGWDNIPDTGFGGV